MNPKISIIVALGHNRVIGKDGKIPWHVSEDLKRFKRLTTGHAVVMGRKTYESIGKPLPNRTNIVITRGVSSPAGCIAVHSLDEALARAREVEKDEIFVIGGGEIYRQAIGLADKLYLTVVHKEFEGDAFFPDYSAFTKVLSQKEGESDGLRFTFLELARG